MRHVMRLGVGASLLLVLMTAMVPTCVCADDLTVSVYRDYSAPADKMGRWAVRVYFNYPVFPSNLAEAATAKQGQEKLDFKVINPDDDREAAGPGRQFRLVSPSSAVGGDPVKIVIKKDLSDSTGSRLLARDYSYEFQTVDKVSVNSWGTFYKGKKEKGLDLTLTQFVSERALKSALKITPEVSGLNVTRTQGWNYRITGDFQYQKDYVLRISTGDVDGRENRAIFVEREIRFKGPGIKADIVCRTDRSVVELRGRQLFPLTLSNVDKVRCRLKRIPPYLASAPDPMAAVDHGQKESPDSGVAKALAKVPGVPKVFLGDSVEDSEAFFAPDALDHVLGYSLPLTFRKNPDQGGIWKAVFSDPDGNFRGETAKVVQITDLSISYKISAENLLLWVTSLHSGLPVAAVDVMLVDDGGGRFIAGKTDKSGVLFLKQGAKLPALKWGKEAAGLSERPLDIDRLTNAIAATAQDACSVELRNLRLKPLGIKQTQKISEKSEPHTGYVFTERGVYRPGETVHFKCYSRVYEDHRIISPQGQEVKVEIVDPRGDSVYAKDLTLGEFGSIHDSLHLEKFFPSGTYTINAGVISGDGQKTSFTRTFLVQEYKRPRHLVTLAFKQEERIATEYIGVQRKDEFLTVDVQARYYTGGPVKHARVRWKATLAPAVLKAPGHDGYSFGNEDEKDLFLESGESLTDGSGKLNFSIPLDARLLTGMYGVKVSATVLDIDGEPATEAQTFQPQPRFLVGISGHPRQVPGGYAVPLKLVLLDQEGKKVPQGKIEACIMHKKYLSVQKRDDAGNLNYLWEEGWMKTYTSQLAVKQGEALFDFQLNEYGEYLISFTYQDKTGKYASQTMFKVGWEDYDSWIRERSEKDVRTTDAVFVSTAKKEYRVGESVRVAFHTARPVKQCLVTVEKGGVLEYRVLEVNGTDGTYEFSARESFQPNVYVSVLAAAGREGYPVYQSQVDLDVPTVFFGCADVTVRRDSQKFRVDIAPGVPELTGRPAEKKTLSFKVTDDKGQGTRAELAVCVVDEAVLALTRFKTPDLSSLNDFNLPLTVFSGDLRLALVSQDLFRLLGTRPLTGGDAGLGAVAASLKMRKDFRPVAYFNPEVITDPAGKATVEFQLPDSTTAYRVYVVACDAGPRFASAQRNMVVTKEFFIEPSPPRFLIAGDRVTFPVSLNNKTAQKGEAFVEAEGSALFKVDLAKSATQIEPWSTVAVDAAGEALGTTDSAAVRFKGMLRSASEKFSDAIEQTFPIYSRYMPVNRAIIGDFSKTAEVAVALPQALKDLKPGEVSTADFHARISLSTTNWTRIAPGLKYLLHYPYGCVEQTSSGVIPLAGLRGLVKQGLFPGITTEEVDKFLKRGVERLLSMQVGGGGFAYWPGETQTSWWGTMYATYALTAAKEAGYQVPEKNLHAALECLHTSLFKKDDKDPYHGAAWTREFAVINLALGAMLSDADLERFFGDYDSLSNQSKALLLLAAKRTEYLPDEKIHDMVNQLNPQPDSGKNHYYNSTVREIAMCLMAAVASGSNESKADAWAGYLLRSIKPDGKWESTADTGWALLALSQYYEGKKTTKKPGVQVRIDYGEAVATEVKVSDTTAYVDIPVSKLLEKGKIVLQGDSDTLVNYTVSVTYPDLTKDAADLEKGFILTKKMENLNGKEEIRVGDVVRITLDLDFPNREGHSSSERLEYLALEDPVPAGLVPISSALKTEGVEQAASGEEYDSWKDGYYELRPTYSEFRDDGVRVFRNRLWTYHYRYSYLARAVAQGDFWMRGSRVSLMYNPERFGKTLGKSITVLPASK